jgi:CBS domain-containing protein
MTPCPTCGQPNIDGADTCDACSESLTTVQSRRGRTKIERRIESETLATLNPHVPVCVGPDEAVARAVRLLAEKNIGCVLVVEGGKLVGIFSERDVLMKIGNRYSDCADLPVRDFMTPNPETLGPQDSIAFALNRMAVGDYRHVPIEKDGRPAGVVSVRDLLGYIAQQCPETRTRTA